MFDVNISTLNNVFKPEVTDKTVIVLKQTKPFVQMSYVYDGDFSNLTDEEATTKVLDDFYKENYKDKIQEGKVIKLELAYLEQQKAISELSNYVSELKNPKQEESDIYIPEDEEPEMLP